jgi:hypothetical protein
LKEFTFGSLLKREHLGSAAVLVVFTPLLWNLFSTHTFMEGPDGVYSGGSAFYDLCFHSALASSFAYGDNFPPGYTPFAGESLRYPFLPDFHAAALMVAGLSMRCAFLATALPLVLALVGIFYGFALRITVTASGAALAVALFLLNGGLGFIDLFQDWRDSGRGLLEFWMELPRNYANDWTHAIHWTNIITDTLLPQRAALYGLPAGLIILTLFAIVWEDKPELHAAARQKMLLVAGLIAGALPLFHTHSYIAVGSISVVLFVLRPRREWLWFWVPAVLLASPQLFDLLTRAGDGDILRLQAGWMGSDAPSFAIYMLRNFGIPLLLAAPAWISAPREWKTFYIAALLLLVFALTVVVSPNVFDNGKLSYYWHAVNSVLVARWLVTLARTRPVLTAPLAVLLASLSVITGMAAIAVERREHKLLFGLSDLAAARFVRDETPPRSRFLTTASFNHPVLTLAGRQVVRGPTDWLWGHGYEFRAREWDVRRIYAGGAEALQLLNYYHVDYLFIGEAERRDLGADEAFFAANLRRVYRSDGVSIYETNSTAATSGKMSDERDIASQVGRDPFAVVAEFPRVGYFVHRILAAQLGRPPVREEFMSALKTLGAGLHVGATGWEAQLEENRRALARGLANGDGLVAESLLSAARKGDVDPHDYDEAYVRAHFFGYLVRDPDPAGFNFWLDVLSRNKDYRSLSRSFLESEEYKHGVEQRIKRALEIDQPNTR